MRRQKPQKSTQNTQKQSSHSKLKGIKKKSHAETESTPWFFASDKTPENIQINKYITARFSEFNDGELIEFLKNSKPYREIVADIRKAYLFTEQESSRRRAA